MKDFRKMLEAALGSAPDPQTHRDLKAALDSYDNRSVQPLSGGGGGNSPPTKPKLP